MCWKRKLLRARNRIKQISVVLKFSLLQNKNYLLTLMFEGCHSCVWNTKRIKNFLHFPKLDFKVAKIFMTFHFLKRHFEIFLSQNWILFEPFPYSLNLQYVIQIVFQRLKNALYISNVTFALLRPLDYYQLRPSERLLRLVNFIIGSNHNLDSKIAAKKTVYLMDKSKRDFCKCVLKCWNIRAWSFSE